MTAHRELAASLSARALDRIEADRCLNSGNVAEAIFEGLVVSAAKDDSEVRPDLDTYVAPQFAAVLDAAAALVRLMHSNRLLAAGTPTAVRHAIDDIWRALSVTGWKP